VAAAAGDHVGQRQLAAGDHAVQVDLDRRPDRLLGLVEERPDRHHARVVDQHVDVAAAVGARLVEERRERLAVGDVERVARHLAELGQLRHRRLLQSDVTVTDHHAGAASQQGLGGGITDTAGGAGDRDGLAPDVVHGDELYTCQVLIGSGWASRVSTSHFGRRLRGFLITMSRCAAAECTPLPRVGQ
jgi:hypothetical protein